MEEDKKEPDKDDEEEEEEENNTVLWEKYIQQSIFVDLSEDESLHLSDFENSLALHFSQVESAPSEPSIHLIGSVELSELEDSSKESNTVSSKSAKASKSKSKSSICHVSVQRPNTMHEPPSVHECEDSELNTSDEDQEDLPYDGDLRIRRLVGNTDEVHTDHGGLDLLEMLQENRSVKKDNDLKTCNPTVVTPPWFSSGHISHLLLQHFSKNKHLHSENFIEGETLPDVSLLESVDDTVLSLISAHNSTSGIINSESTKCSSKRSKVSSKSQSSKIKAENEIGPLTLFGSGDIESSPASESINTEQAKEKEDDDQGQRVPLVRTKSLSEMKYGQGQVHYPLPDFSKVTPKVKIPKVQNGPNKSIPQPLKTIYRVQSSPGMLEVINRVLKDSDQPLESPHVFKDIDKKPSPALVLRLQNEYDKLLTKYAEIKNSIDDLRLTTKIEVKSEELNPTQNYVNQDVVCDKTDELQHLAVAGNILQSKQENIHHGNTRETIAVFSKRAEDSRSDGEKITSELRDIIKQFIQKVQNFKFNVSNMTTSTEEQQMMLRSMMEAQDQLVRNYMSKKEEHRALEMQNYMGLSRNIGAFDPNRILEGDIFRIGMELEDIKETVDGNIFKHISPPNYSSTPTNNVASEHANVASKCMFVPSPIYLSHEVKEEEEIDQEDPKKNTEVSENAGSNQSRDLMASDPAMHPVGRKMSPPCSIEIKRDQLSSLQRPNSQTVEGEEDNKKEESSVLSEVTDDSDISASLCGKLHSPKETKETGSSWSICDPPDAVNPPVGIFSPLDAQKITDRHGQPAPPLLPSCMSQKQRIICPETDSGFGSSYLNQSTFQSNPPISIHSQSETGSCTDSEGSYSNLQTAVISATQCDHQKTSSQCPIQHREAAAAIKQWLETSTKKPSVQPEESLQIPPAQHHQQVPVPVPITVMETGDASSPMYPCSCNNAILALQSEVLRLKKELEDGLVQLPHLAQRMDYLTSKYTQETQRRKYKSSSNQTSEISNVKKSSGKEEIHHGSSKLKLEDWISSDMDPSKSNGTSSEDTSSSEILTHDSSRERRRDKRTVCTSGEIIDKQLPKTERNKAGTLNVDSTLKREIDLPSGRAQASGKSFQSKNMRPRPSDLSHHKPLLQVNYGSSSSLPASYKVKEPHLQTTSHRRKDSTQSDTAMLPSDVYFMQTGSPHPVSPRTANKTSRRRGKKDEEMKRALDQAIKVALTMKKTTDRMARRLSADLAKAQQIRKRFNMQPLGSNKHKHK